MESIDWGTSLGHPIYPIDTGCDLGRTENLSSGNFQCAVGNPCDVFSVGGNARRCWCHIGPVGCAIWSYGNYTCWRPGAIYPVHKEPVYYWRPLYLREKSLLIDRGYKARLRVCQSQEV